MSGPTTEAGELARRLDRLERANNRLRAALAGVALAACVAVLAGAGDKPKKEEPTELTVKDADGKARIRFAVGSGGPGIAFLDPNGTVRGRIDMDPEGLSFRYADRNGRLESSMSLQLDGLGLVNTIRGDRAQIGLNAILVVPGPALRGDARQN